MKVKICGMQTYEDAKHAIDAGADFVGFIFYKNSTRAVDVSTAKDIIKKIKGQVSIVGVFKNSSLDEVNSLCEELNFDLVQLHGQESQEFCNNVNLPVVKTFGLLANFSINNTVRQMKQYDVKYYLIDRENPGEGELLPLDRSTEIAKNFPIFFAGGLTPENVGEAVSIVRPFAVDVITGVKTDGKFDFEKMKQFVINAKGVKV
ncbi:MAG TPA: phosphoribosylanthranilate isomerase [Candidatus Saccharimonadales bacterium]|nr:phosphoribosylanthranilate isomerase [Candidatus Saccharimonadales bacterium]